MSRSPDAPAQWLSDEVRSLLRRGAKGWADMADDDLLVLTGDEVRGLLAHREAAVLDAVRSAYLAHGAGQTSLPHSLFLRFPEQSANRIIALPAVLGDGFGVAGMKWISSFPGNHQRGLPRASAVMVLNSCATGRPEAFLEASLISAARTAASAAAAAAALAAGTPPATAGLIGTGPINLEVARYLRAALPSVRNYLLYDLEAERAERAAAALAQAHPGIEARVATNLEEALSAPLVSFGTTALTPHVHDLSACPPGAVILHVSLRDLAPELLLACDNVVDDADHVCRAETSVHLAEKLSGSRAFIRCNLADVLSGRAEPRRDASSIVVFSPFGLGILDLAVGALVRDLAVAGGSGHTIAGFQPSPPAGAVTTMRRSAPAAAGAVPAAAAAPPTSRPAARHLLSILDLSSAQLARRVDDALAIARGAWDGRQPLAGRTAGIYFRKTSTRTRTSFTVGAQRLGAAVVAYGPNDLQIATGETLSDTARVLANYLDVLVVRTNESVDEMREMARQDRMSVVNAMSDNEHPTQVIADLTAMREALGPLAGTHLLFVGEGNNTAASLALAVAKTPGMRLTLITPESYGLPAADLEAARRLAAEHGAAIEQHHDIAGAPAGVDAVYTTRWLTMGVAKKDPDWLDRFRPYCVTPELMHRVSKPRGTVFLHDLPAMRGFEVENEVLDGPQSIAFRQAFHKLTAAMSVLAWCAGVTD